MRSATAGLIALLNSGADFATADLYTLTLSGGTVVRWSGTDRALVDASANTFALGPILERNEVTEKIGIEVGTLTLTLTANADDLINGTPIIPFIAGRGLDGANLRLDKGYYPDWNSACTGTLLRFSGKITSIGEIAGSSIQITVSSWLILLNANMPANLYQAGCLHTVYDAGCTLNPASFSGSGTITAGATQMAFGSGLSTTANDYAQGRVTFTSGANNGLSRAIKANDGAGGFTLVSPLPAAPSAGDTFTAYKGCDLTKATCNTKFNNLGHFKATPYVPAPETAL
jgi:uncharacterized phage protein (TIGR02218 family)